MVAGEYVSRDSQHLVTVGLSPLQLCFELLLLGQQALTPKRKRGKLIVKHNLIKSQVTPTYNLNITLKTRVSRHKPCYFPLLQPITWPLRSFVLALMLSKCCPQTLLSTVASLWWTCPLQKACREMPASMPLDQHSLFLLRIQYAKCLELVKDCFPVCQLTENPSREAGRAGTNWTF